MEINKKKLIFFMPSIEGGGVEKNLIILCNFLSKKFSNICLITFDNKLNHLFNKKIKIINVRDINKKKSYSKYFKYFRCLLLLVCEYFNNRQLLVFSFQANIYVIILATILKFDVISRSNSSPSGWKKNFIKILIFKFFFKFADEIVVNSNQFKREFKKSFGVKTKLIYNPLNRREIKKQSKIKLKFNFFEKKGALKIINIARFTDQKDHLTLLKAIKIVVEKTDIRLLIMGYGKNKYKINNFIKKNGLQKHVKLLNFKLNPFNYLKKANIFVLTSKFEGLPNVLLEAMTLKKLIISTDCPTGPNEILKRGKYGYLFDVGDYNKLAKILININNESLQNKKKINKGYKSLYRFDYRKNCNAYYKIIKKHI